SAGGGMGTRQTKGSLAERASPGAAPGPRRERPDFWASLLLRAGDKAGRAGAGSGLPPYHRRVGMVQELLRMVRQGRREEAGTLLQHLRQAQDVELETPGPRVAIHGYVTCFLRVETPPPPLCGTPAAAISRFQRLRQSAHTAHTRLQAGATCKRVIQWDDVAVEAQMKLEEVESGAQPEERVVPAQWSMATPLLPATKDSGGVKAIQIGPVRTLIRRLPHHVHARPCQLSPQPENLAPGTAAASEAHSCGTETAQGWPLVSSMALETHFFQQGGRWTMASRAGSLPSLGGDGAAPHMAWGPRGPRDLGMESTSLDDVLCRYASFRNLVDPITHDLIISLARYIHCPKPEGDALGAMEKLCRQLTYHLSPHSQWRRHRGLAVLAGSPLDNTVDLSGIPLTPRDLERVTGYLQRCGEQVDSVELGFTGLTDDMVLQLLPALSTLPRLTTLALNGNRLTRALLRDLTDALKDPSKFPSVTWIDLGNNVDIFSLPQPFLLSLRKRSPKQGHLPTILELGEGPGSGDEARDETVGQEDPGGDQEARETT
ncbi:hypothetical protein EI555_006674, partial [Monodon monoceros]